MSTDTPKTTRPTVGAMFRPVDNKCIDCGKHVGPEYRQELDWNKEGQCKRRCEACLNLIKARQ